MDALRDWLFSLPFTGQVESLYQLLADNPHLVAWLSLGSIAIFFISLATLPWLVAQIPEDYFHTRQRVRKPSTGIRRIISPIWRLFKNVLGWTLLVGGFLMLFLPGQGLLTLLVGAMLCNYPGKFRLERKIVSRPKVLGSLNWLRGRAKKPPLTIEQH